MSCKRLVAKALALPLSLGLPLAFGLGLGAAACGDAGESGCTTGSFGCACYPGNICLAGLTCLSGICVQFGGGETGPGDGDPGDGDPGDGDGDPGDGDPGDGDGDPGDGDGDGDPGDGDGDGDGDPGGPCNAGAEVLLYSQGIASGTDSGLFAGTFLDISGKSVELADEFTVPQDETCWCITQVVARGFYNEGIEPANTPNFFAEIYNDGNAVPIGAPIVSAEGPIFVDDAGEYTAMIEMEAVVSAGTHWLSFRPELVSSEALWYWRTMPNQVGDQVAARDEDAILWDGLCAVWTPASACFEGDPPNGNQFSVQFDIIGIIGGGACN